MSNISEKENNELPKLHVVKLYGAVHVFTRFYFPVYLLLIGYWNLCMELRSYIWISKSGKVKIIW